jgi:hypothetical protein
LPTASKVDVDEGADLLALVAKGHRFLDEGEELELVLHVLGGKHGAVNGPPARRPTSLARSMIFRWPPGVQEAGVARVVPAVGGQHLGGGGRVLVVLLEQARALDQDLAVVGHLDLHAVDGHAHGVGLDFVVGLQAHEHRGFGAAVQAA